MTFPHVSVVHLNFHGECRPPYHIRQVMVCVPALQKKLLDTWSNLRICTVAFVTEKSPYNVQVTFGPLPPAYTEVSPGHRNVTVRMT